MKRISWIIGIIIVAFALQSCNNTQNDWGKAKENNTIESFSIFLKKHPESDFTKEATNKIDSLTLVKKINIDSFKEALIATKIENTIFDTLELANLYAFYRMLLHNDKGQQDLINILIERTNIIQDTNNFIAPIKAAEGEDLLQILKPSDSVVSIGDINNHTFDGKELSVEISGLLMGETLGKSLIYGHGKYLAGNDVTRINIKGSYTIDESFFGDFIYSTYYQDDRLYFTTGILGFPEFCLPFGKNTVICIIDEANNFFEGIKIKSDYSFPIHLILKEDGLYYLMGKGEIKINNSKTLVF